MKIELIEKEFVSAWEGDGMRPGDNTRSNKWTGYWAIIEPEENDDKFIVEAIEAFGCHRKDFRVSLDMTEEDIEKDILERAALLKWKAEWTTFFNIPQDKGSWHVEGGYADIPEVYDDYDNYIMIVPNSIQPGDFSTLKKLVDETLEEM